MLIVFLCIFILFATYLVFADYIFQVLIKMSREARSVKRELPQETNNIKFHIDRVKNVILGWKDALTIRGWVFKENVKETHREVYLVLKSKTSTLIFDIEDDNRQRRDISYNYNIADEIDNHGFELRIPVYRLRKGPYKIGFIIEDKTGTYYTLSDTKLRIPRNTIQTKQISQRSLSEFISKQVSLDLKEPTKEVDYHFDEVNISEKHLIVSGWGFIKGMDTGSLKTYISLKKDENVIVYNVQVNKRKDITKRFKDFGRNLNLSGFSSQIPIENLDSGNYQLGLYLIKGDHIGIIYADQHVNVSK